jgi:hypothetical protein
MKIIGIAAVCHEANRALCRSLGDHSQPTWPEAPDWQIQSAITGVEFNLVNPDAPASASHDSWLEEKRVNGWSWGLEKDAELKTHPCYVSFDMLPPEQKAKDHLFKAIVTVLSPLLDGTESYGTPV